MKRRDLLQLAAAGAVGALTIGSPRGFLAGEEQKTPADVGFDEPFDGAVVHERSGSPVVGTVDGPGGKRLKIRVVGSASPAARVELVDVKHPQQRIPVRREGAKFFADVLLADVKTELLATLTDAQGGKKTARARIVWLKDSYPRYRFQVDDNSFFTRDICRKNYKSLFDSPYLGMFRDFHKRYGVKVVLNLFYSTPEEDFNLGQLSDKYKSEWQDNAHWLKLAFHARNEFPNHPFLVRTSQQLAADIELIEAEIRRFAGAGVYTRMALLHWGTIRPESLRVLVDRGWRTLSGSAWPLRSAASKPYRSQYQVPEYALPYVDTHDAWYDFQNGLLFSKIDLCCNRVPLKDTLPTLQRAYADPHTREVMDLATHEQYFWPFYKNYMPDHAQRLDQSFRFVTERGYKAIFPAEDPFEQVRDRMGGL
jgi:hypothetical protein